MFYLIVRVGVPLFLQLLITSRVLTRGWESTHFAISSRSHLLYSAADCIQQWTQCTEHIDMGDIEQLVGSTLAQCQDILSNNNIVYNGQLVYLSVAYRGYVDMFVIYCYVYVSGHKITKVRPIIIDGEHMIVTMDFRQDRINVELADGRVVRIVKAM